MATLKDHQQAMVDLMAHGSGIPASAMRLAHAVHDLIAAHLAVGEITFIPSLEDDATTPGLNDKALAADVEACRPKVTHFDVEINLADMGEVKMTLQNMQSHLDGARDSQRKAERRVKELENTVKQLRASNAKLKEERDYWITTCRGAEHALIRTRQELETTKALPEQAGCRKDDTQVCGHPEGRVDTNIGFCSKCGQYL